MSAAVLLAWRLPQGKYRYVLSLIVNQVCPDDITTWNKLDQLKASAVLLLSRRRTPAVPFRELFETYCEYVCVCVSVRGVYVTDLGAGRHNVHVYVVGGRDPDRRKELDRNSLYPPDVFLPPSPSLNTNTQLLYHSYNPTARKLAQDERDEFLFLFPPLLGDGGELCASCLSRSEFRSWQKNKKKHWLALRKFSAVKDGRR